MTVTPASLLPGVFLVRSEKRGDDRGYLIRTCCEDSLRQAGLNTRWVQSSVTYTAAKGTLRGMHYQKPPFAEIKLIRCLTGAVWDCLVDIRPDSPTFGRWEAFELSEENGLALYVPEGIAHGFITLTPDVRMLYSMSAVYSAPHASGIRWNDPRIGIQWPAVPEVMSSRDETYPDFTC